MTMIFATLLVALGLFVAVAYNRDLMRTPTEHGLERIIRHCRRSKRVHR